jgi:hypothetical protein
MNEQNTENQATIVPAVASVAAPAVAPVVALPDTSQTVKKIADRPHWITIVLGLVSPLLAGVALIISLESLHTSERTLEVGQRAYVAIQNKKITFSRIIPGPPPAPSSAVRPSGGEIQTRLEQIATMDVSITLANSGNTPAEFTRFTPTFKQLPQGWTLNKKAWQPIQKTPSVLGAKSQTVWEYHEGFLLTPEAWSAYSQPGISSALFFSGELQYLDVFKKEHRVDWCWMVFAKENNFYSPVDCGEMTFERTK